MPPRMGAAPERLNLCVRLACFVNCRLLDFRPILNRFMVSLVVVEEEGQVEPN